MCYTAKTTCGCLTSLKTSSKSSIKVFEQMIVSSSHISETSIDGSRDCCSQIFHNIVLIANTIMYYYIAFHHSLFISVFFMATSSTTASNTKLASITAQDNWLSTITYEYMIVPHLIRHNHSSCRCSTEKVSSAANKSSAINCTRCSSKR